MNRKDACKLMTFVGSMVCAVSAAAFCHYSAERALRRNERALRRELFVRFDESVDGRSLIDEWKQAKTVEEQRRLWKEWTQLKLDEEPWWFSATSERMRPEVEFGELMKRTEELERLKSDGWQTMDGGPLHLTPEQVWYFLHSRRIRKLRDLVDSSRLRFWVASPVGGLVGFYGVWIVYVAASLIVWPALGRIAPGFRKEKHKDKSGGLPL
jgi:hypothetical protein